MRDENERQLPAHGTSALRDIDRLQGVDFACSLP
jgi:hypothetical protein